MRANIPRPALGRLPPGGQPRWRMAAPGLREREEPGLDLGSSTDLHSCPQTELIVRCLKEDVNPVMDNRDALKFTLKLFLSPSVDAAEVKEAVEFALTQLGLNYAEILIVAFADNMDEKLKGEDVLQVWRVLEDLVRCICVPCSIQIAVSAEMKMSCLLHFTVIP
jgi:hypothetical protein